MWKKIVGIGAVFAALSIGLAACGNDKASSSKNETVGDSVKYKITGIDPGAGIMTATEKALKEYKLDDWELVTGSSAAMTAALKKGIRYKKEPITFLLAGIHTGCLPSMI